MDRKVSLDGLRPGDIVAISPQPGYNAIAGQILSADAGSVTLVEPPTSSGIQGRIETIPAEHISTVTRRGSNELPRTIVRSYVGKQQADTVRAFERDASVLARAGYEPGSQSWAPGQWGCGAFLVALLLAVVLIGIVIFLYLLVVKPDGTLTVTFTRRESSAAVLADAAPTDKEKICPRCAETVKAAAKVCRFCGHEFEPAAERRSEEEDRPL